MSNFKEQYVCVKIVVYLVVTVIFVIKLKKITGPPDKVNFNQIFNKHYNNVVFCKFTFYALNMSCEPEKIKIWEVTWNTLNFLGKPKKANFLMNFQTLKL
jgi:hypothetical protein